MCDTHNSYMGQQITQHRTTQEDKQKSKCLGGGGGKNNLDNANGIWANSNWIHHMELQTLNPNSTLGHNSALIPICYDKWTYWEINVKTQYRLWPILLQKFKLIGRVLLSLYVLHFTTNFHRWDYSNYTWYNTKTSLTFLNCIFFSLFVSPLEKFFFWKILSFPT